MHKHRTITFIIEVILVTLAAVSVGACGGSISLDLSRRPCWLSLRLGWGLLHETASAPASLGAR